MLYKYSIVNNTYEGSEQIKDKLICALERNMSFLEDNKNKPDFVFVIGGDGTFLSAIHKFKNSLKNTFFVPIKFGGVGFYTGNNNHFTDNYDKLLDYLLSKKLNFFEYQLLEIISKNQHNLALNEIKIINNFHPLELTISVNNEILETFRGSGLAFSTPSGSSGFTKSANGAIIYQDTNLYQMLELAPISSNKFRTINSPIIFSNNQKITINMKEQLTDSCVIIDTINWPIQDRTFTIKLSDLFVKVISLTKEKITKTKLLNQIFVFNDQTKTQ